MTICMQKMDVRKRKRKRKAGEDEVHIERNGNDESKDLHMQVNSQLLVGFAQGQMHMNRKQEYLEAQIASLLKAHTHMRESLERVESMVQHLYNSAQSKRHVPELLTEKNETHQVSGQSTKHELMLRAASIRKCFQENRNDIYTFIRKRFPKSDNIECPTLVFVKALSWPYWPAQMVLEYDTVPDEIFLQMEQLQIKSVKDCVRHMPVRWLCGRSADTEAKNGEKREGNSYTLVNLNDKMHVISYEIGKSRAYKPTDSGRKTRRGYNLASSFEEANEILEDYLERKRSRREEQLTQQSGFVSNITIE
mmetsp:Transcript_19721/g.33811  ORF Transcript_19721/g.33811 Transcript_19721/m.33811 type:complete len:307 (-) Transcript_19721:4058-4978(-)